MVIVDPRRDYRRVYRRQYGKGIGSFFKNTLKSAVNVGKSVGKAAAAGAKTLAKKTVEAAKTGAKAAGQVIKTQGKEIAKQALASGKEVAKTAMGHAAELGKDLLQQGVQSAVQIGMEHGTKLLGDIAAGKDIKESVKDFSKNAMADAKLAGKDLMAQGKAGLRQVGIKTISDVTGIPIPEPVQAMDPPEDFPDQYTEDPSIDPEQLYNLEEYDATAQEGAGMRRRGRPKKSKALSELLAAIPKKRKSKKKDEEVGGAAYLYGTGSGMKFIKGAGQSGKGLIIV